MFRAEHFSSKLFGFRGSLTQEKLGLIPATTSLPCSWLFLQNKGFWRAFLLPKSFPRMGRAPVLVHHSKPPWEDEI